MHKKDPKKTPNELISESSPYLLQHAYNPVAWQPWGQKALQQAKNEDKPILVSIGYSTCHWCHVMERESFEDVEVAAFMNAHYVCIKIDREERPDLDQIYMDACQIMTGAGGWPLNVFLTPDALPFYAGTYFPPKPAYQRPSWYEVLHNLHKAWVHQRDTVLQQAQRLHGYIVEAEQHMLERARKRMSDQINTEQALYGDRLFHQGHTEQIFYNLRERFDRQDGGFGTAPKFPQLMTIQFLLEYAHFRDNDEALLHAVLSLERMCTGGIYDQLAGGLARYSTDNEWLAPHFEKMLYDNALFISTLSSAVRMIESAERYRGKDLSDYNGALKLFKETIQDTVIFCLRQMSVPGFAAYHSAIDADSEGVEGKYYVWSKQEIEELLTAHDAERFCDLFDVTTEGNWEHTNILRRMYTDNQFASKWVDGKQWLEENLPKAKKQLLAARASRVHPGIDDKVLISSNALLVSALVQAYRALQEPDLLQRAEECLQFLLEAFRDTHAGCLLHTWKDGTAKVGAFLDDYAYTIAACLDVYEATGMVMHVQQARELTAYVVAHFGGGDAFFYFTPATQSDVIVRKVDFYDNATPSGNSTMVHNLLRIGYLYGDLSLIERAHLMLKQAMPLILEHPTSFAVWAQALQKEAHGFLELAVTGPDAKQRQVEVHAAFLPNAVIATEVYGQETIPLLEGRVGHHQNLYYLCKEMQCLAPETQFERLLEAM